ncbi:peptidoglycan/LPS O-acetylase OafA/YrhL [Streptomyces sp. 846.5]|nr:peptidoglycan/LPS O-acetylase OafA/YrhL [Streptomyces sp. 846.5]
MQMADSADPTTRPVSTMQRDGVAHEGDTAELQALPEPAAPPAAPVPAATSPTLPAGVGHGLLGLAYLGLIAANSTAPLPGSVPVVDVLLVLCAFTVSLSALQRLTTPGSLSPGRKLLLLLKQYGAALPFLLGALLGIVWLTGGLDAATALQRQLPGALLQVSDWAGYSTDHVLPSLSLGSSHAPWPFAVLWPLSVVGQYALLWPLLLTLLAVLVRRSVTALGALLLLLTAAPAVAVTLLPSASLPGFLRSALGLAVGERLLDLTAGAAAACVVLLVLRRRQAAPARTGGVRTALWTSAELLVVVAAVVGWFAGRADALSPLLRSLGLKPDAVPLHRLYDGADLRGLALHALIVAVPALLLTLGGGLLSAWLRRPLLVEIGRMGYLLTLVGALMTWLLHRGWPGLPWYGLLIVGTGLGWLLTLCVYYPTWRLALRSWSPLRALPLLLAACLLLGLGSWKLPAHAAAALRPDGRQLVLGLGDQLTGDLALSLNHSGGPFAGRSGVRSGSSAAEDCGLMDCPGWQQQWQSALQSTHPDLVVLHLGRDAAQHAGTNPAANTCTAAYRAEYLGLLSQAVAVVHRSDPGVPVLLANERLDNSAAEPIGTACYNQRIQEFTDAHKGVVRLLDLNAELCPAGACRQATPQGIAFYGTVDGTRISAAGRALVAPWLEQQLRQAAKAGSQKARQAAS